MDIKYFDNEEEFDNEFERHLYEKMDEYNAIPLLYFENETDASTYEEEVIKVNDVHNRWKNL